MKSLSFPCPVPHGERDILPDTLRRRWNSILQSFLDLLFGDHRGETLEEESYPRDAMGRPDLSRFTKPLADYAAYFDKYLASLGPQGPASSTARQLAYRKSVLAQWG